MMKKLILTLLVAIFVSGCASPKAVTKNYLVDQKDKYIAINLDVDAGRYVAMHEANVVEHIYDSFEQSGLFSDVETSFRRWPVTVQVKYSWEQPEINTGKGFAKTMVSASTLLLIPAVLTENHTLKVRIVSGNNIVEAFEFTEEVETALSLYHDPVEDRKNGISRMMEKVFDKIKKEKLIPTVMAIEKQIKAQQQKITL